MGIWTRMCRADEYADMCMLVCMCMHVSMYVCMLDVHARHIRAREHVGDASDLVSICACVFGSSMKVSACSLNMCMHVTMRGICAAVNMTEEHDGGTWKVPEGVVLYVHVDLCSVHEFPFVCGAKTMWPRLLRAGNRTRTIGGAVSIARHVNASATGPPLKQIAGGPIKPCFGSAQSPPI